MKQTMKIKKEALQRGERASSRVFKLEMLPDGTFRRIELEPETHRRQIKNAWDARTEVSEES